MARVYLTAFGDVALPLYNSRLSGGTAPSRVATLTLADGRAYDAIGADQAEPELPYVLNYEAVNLEDTEAAHNTALAALSAMRGKRAKLYRQLLSDDEVIHWAWARLLRKGETSGVGAGSPVHLPQQFQIQVLSPWYGHDHRTWLLDDGEYLNEGLFLDDGGFTETMASSPHTLTVTNGGNGIVRNAIITITAGSANITALTITSGDTDIDWSGTLTAGNSLVIDCGAKSILNNGSNAYSGFAYGGSHALNGWLEIAPGAVDITITFTGGSTDSTVTVEFRDVHE